MGFKIAFQAFMKAWKEPEKAKEFLQEDPKQLELSDPSHLRLLTLLQQSGRLIDFLKEFVTIRPVRDENEGTIINVEKGYDPSLLKVVGKVSGEPPYSGVLIHKGWKAHKKSLPKKIGKQTSEVIYPAEVEIK